MFAEYRIADRRETGSWDLLQRFLKKLTAIWCGLVTIGDDWCG
jgi:hypothetical protein